MVADPRRHHAEARARHHVPRGRRARARRGDRAAARHPHGSQPRGRRFRHAARQRADADPVARLGAGVHPLVRARQHGRHPDRILCRTLPHPAQRLVGRARGQSDLAARRRRHGRQRARAVLEGNDPGRVPLHYHRPAPGLPARLDRGGGRGDARGLRLGAGLGHLRRQGIPQRRRDARLARRHRADRLRVRAAGLRLDRARHRDALGHGASHKRIERTTIRSAAKASSTSFREEAMKHGRSLLPLFAAVLACTLTAANVDAEDYPNRQITLIAPWPAGGAVDALCRAVAVPLSERLGRSVVVENRPGAGSVIGTAAGAKAAPDGYTLVMPGSGSLAISATMYKKLPYDPVKDFIPLTLVAKIPFVLVVTPSLPVHSVGELVAYAKENPGKLSYGSGGPGSPHHLQAELLKSMTGIAMTHVPYKGSAPALTDVIAGHIAVMFSDTVPSLPQIKEGKVRALGVSTATRVPSAPDIPSVAEAGVPGFDAAGWGVIAVPAGTPSEIVGKLKPALDAVMTLPEIKQQIIMLGMIPGGAMPPEALHAFIDAEIARWGKVVTLAGLAGTE